MNPQSQVEKIALYLGKPWKFNRLCKPSNYYFEVIDGEGRVLVFRIEQDKFKIGGRFSTDKTVPWIDDHRDIGISLFRDPKEAAADIKRRLISHYLVAYDRATARYIEQQEKECSFDLIEQAFIKVTKGWSSTISRAYRTVHFRGGTVEIKSDKTVNLVLAELTIEQAMRIAAMVRKDEVVM